MAKWQDMLTDREEQRLMTLWREIRRLKPKSWSAVWRENEVSVRPSNRELGRFSVVFSERHGFGVAFFCRALGIWERRQTFADTPGSAAEIVHWMVRESEMPHDHAT